MVCLYVSNAIWCLSHILNSKLVLKSDLTEDKLYFVSYLQLIKQHISVCKSFVLCKMGSETRHNKSRSTKRKEFAGNFGDSIDNNQQQVQLPTSASAKKLKTSSETETSCGITHGCNFIIDSDLFILLVTMIGRCPECVAAVNIQHMIAQKMGLAQFFAISCTECDLAYQLLFIKRGYQVK